MKKYSTEDIDNFLKVIDPLLNGYPEDVVKQFKETVKNPKDGRTQGKVELLLSLADSSIKYNKMALEDGVIVKDEKQVLEQYPTALTSAMRSMLYDTEEQIKAQKRTPQAKSQDKSFWRKVVDFVKNPKTLIAASVILPATGAVAGEKNDVTDNKQQVTIHYSPQTFDEALKDVTEIVMKNQKETSQKEKTS